MNHRLLSILVSIIGLLGAGCTVAGTSSIRNGRAAYNDAMVATNNEQVLAQIVRMRYQETSSMLAVSSITANVRIQASVGSEFGFGEESNYSGNLVPLRAGALYEENPTISYTPVDSVQYLRQLLSPLPLQFTALLMSAIGESPATMTLLIKEINGIRNPAFLTDPSTPADARFEEIAELLASLHRRGYLAWAHDTEPADSDGVTLLLRGEGDVYAGEVVRLHELLGLDPPERPEDMITVSVDMGIGVHKPDEILLRTRSAFELFQIAAASVDVPPEHLESGLAPQLPPVGPVGAQIRVRRAKGRPGQALVAVKHHGWWYFIDATDSVSKGTFRILESISTARIADAVSGNSARPVLTVPVSR